jgi:uncharacterized membrane protein
MGAKLFAWLGGLAAFLGAAFFIKYSFEHDLVPASARIALGYLFGAGLVVMGVRIRSRRYSTTSQTLTATGIVVLYAVTYAANSYYHFAWSVSTFVIMSAITATAFGLAVRLDAPVVALLGMAGGFLTPVLLSTGRDAPLALFSYVALLDAGLVAVALRRRWHYLVPLATAGTLVLECGWAVRFLTSAKTGTAVAIALTFCAEFSLAYALAWARARKREADGANGRAPAELLWAVIAFSAHTCLLNVRLQEYAAFAGDVPLVFGTLLAAMAGPLVLSWLSRVEWLPGVALAGAAVVQYSWRLLHPSAATVPHALAAFLLIAVVFAVYPIALRRRFLDQTGPWAVGALSGLVQFGLVYDLLRFRLPAHSLGLLPALFALPPAGVFVLIARSSPADSRARLNQLAWYGAVVLAFVTAIVPIQFERQWITIGWAFEGVALLWLFRRVPHRGLSGTGIALLVTAFLRLAFNPAVLDYHARSGTPLLNWYLYTYGAVAAALFIGARLAATSSDPVLNRSGVAPLTGLGTVLLFLLVNIEIADFFTRPGATSLTFEFSGNLARDLTYTISWSLFALGLLLVGLSGRVRAARIAGLGLLGVTALKLFLHDLAQLEALYRIAALFVVAIIAIAASFAYQRFADRGRP